LIEITEFRDRQKSMNLTVLDIIFIITIIFTLVRGWQTGFIFAVLDLASMIAALLVAFGTYERVAPLLVEEIGLAEAFARPVAFLLILIGSQLFLLLMSRVLANLFPARVHRHEANRMLGLLPGFVEGLVTVAFIANLLLFLPIGGSLRVMARDSLVANRFSTLATPFQEQLEPVFGDAINQSLELLTVHPESDELIELPYQTNEALPAATLEQEMLELINEERVRAGLTPVVMDEELTRVARDHSRDMFERGYFAHLTPEGITPFDRMKAAGVDYVIAGENLAHAATLSVAHSGLMNSPGHRANILRPEFGRIGIGILDGGEYGLMITQNFRN
jgi:uncharacterized protein YkwD